jgi:hypothetical protein
MLWQTNACLHYLQMEIRKMSIDGSWLAIFDSGRCGVVNHTLEQSYPGFILFNNLILPDHDRCCFLCGTAWPPSAAAASWTHASERTTTKGV